MPFLQIYPTTEKVLILNTPKRNELLKDGPPRNAAGSVLGRGAFGTVFKAMYRGNPVAVKIVKNQLANTMANEAHILYWTHHNIVKILMIESTPQFGLVIMEYYRGHCLQSVLDAIKLPLIHRIFVSMDLVSALTYCHAQELLHLDVKPHNVLVYYKNVESPLRSYICKLTDFGSSIKIGQLSIIKGTIRYMSPEALREEQLTPAADIYSLGITMWQLEKRRMPYYWLQCNESVAYQVVKLEMRPDSRLQQNSKGLHAKKISSKDPSSLPLQSIKLLKDLLNQVKIVLKLDVKWAISKASRNLNTLFDLSAASEEFQFDIHNNFISPIPISDNNTKFELIYANIYKNCWHCDPKKRLSSLELQEELANLLAKCFL